MLMTDKDVCCGCSACAACCPVGAITMRPDGEGFIYPIIDKTKCVKCGLCNQGCPVLNSASKRTPLQVHAAKAKDDSFRLGSSSGGIFSLLATNVISNGGLVFGAAFDASDWHVCHCSAENEEQLAGLRGSKYVQSDIGNAYSSIAQALKIGREVMFTGTPCQIAGLKSYLGCGIVESGRLLLVDVACHAVPSPLAWKKYLEKRVCEAYKEKVDVFECVSRISFRSKDCGWKKYSVSLKFANGMEYLCTYSEDAFMRGFLAELYNRPSCHNCSFRKFKSGSDITIADYWGVSTKFPEMDDDKGTSLILLNTDQGIRAWQAIECATEHLESDFGHAVKYNSALICSKSPHPHRDRFFSEVAGKDFDSVVDYCLRPSFSIRFRRYVVRLLKKLGAKK